jgi:tetratricopeptide (TPR) repeat protein/energy-coupling factor transporter ATP-binding protein EcfA2
MAAPSSARYDVFLSHSRADKPRVEELARRLKQAGIEPFLDKWNLVPGDPWQEALEAALVNSTACAVFVGAGGFSPWQNEELRAAIEHRVSGSRGGYRVIPVLLPEASQPDAAGLPRFLLRGTWVLFSRSLDDKQAFHSLVCGIRGIAPGPGPGQAIFEGECPYRGLEVFEEKHARFFFGREAQVDWLLSHRLAPMAESSHARRFLAILGPSGSGKSSLALAGLIPALKAGKAEGSAGWPIVVFRPGSNPLESLTIELSRAGLAESSAKAIQDLISALAENRTTLHLTARLALKAPAARLVVLADQFEEIFTLCNDEALRHALIENLLHTATVVGGPVVVLLTMRVDFLGKCAAEPDLAAALSDGQELVGPMSKDELRLAIERPADLAGCTLEPGLTDLLLQDVQGQVGALPLLEYTLLELWRERLGNRLTIAAYNGMGKVQGALEHRADAVLEGFHSRPGEIEICRRIFLRLTQPGEGTEDTKRRAAFDELIASEAERPAVEEVVHKLADARLITTEGRDTPVPPGEGHPSGYVEVAHEALIRGWKQLRQWIDADRAGLRTHRQLTEAARDWQDHNRDESYLYVGSRLAVAREWSESHAPDLNPLEREFLDASLALRSRREAEELEAARRLAEEAQAREESERNRAKEAEARKREAEAAAKRQRRLSRWVLLAAVLAGVLAAAAGFQTLRETKARHNATKARDDATKARDDATKARDDATIAAGKEAEARKQAVDSLRDLAKANNDLGAVLTNNSQWEEAIAALRKAVELDPKNVYGYGNLGRALSEKGKYDEAIPILRKAIELDPKNVYAHNNLSFALNGEGQYDEAIPILRKAIELDPKNVYAYNNLGWALNGKGQYDEAIPILRKAIELDPKSARAYQDLGWALNGKGQYDEAIPILRKAIELDPKFVPTYNKLGWALNGKGQYDEAIPILRKAIEFYPKDANAHSNLGDALAGKGQMDEAIAEYRAAIQLKPDFSMAHCKLGLALQGKGQFGEALAALRRGHELGSKNPGWSYPSVQQLVTLEGRLPVVLRGEDHPADADERVKFAWIGYIKGFYAASAQLYEEAFTANHELAENMDAGHRYNAACAAALAGGGRGQNEPPLDEEGRARWRKRALDWLRADLEIWKARAASPIQSARNSVIQTLQHWLRDPDLAGLRDNETLEKLSEKERDQWRTLWAEVKALLDQAKRR